jgi:hypothetical protein
MEGGAVRHFRVTAGLVAASIAVGGFAALPAQAHNGCVGYGSNVACTRDNHSIMDACDRELDGMWVVAEAIDGRGGYWYVWDGNGPNSGCGNKRVNLPGDAIYRVCEAHNLHGPVHQCSGWSPV